MYQRSVRAHSLHIYLVLRLLRLRVFIAQIIAEICLNFQASPIIFQKLNDLKINLALINSFVLIDDLNDFF